MDRVVWVYLNIDHNDEIGLTCEKTFPSSLKDKEEVEVKLSFKPDNTCHGSLRVRKSEDLATLTMAEALREADEENEEVWSGA